MNKNLETISKSGKQIDHLFQSLERELKTLLTATLCWQSEAVNVKQLYDSGITDTDEFEKAVKQLLDGPGIGEPAEFGDAMTYAAEIVSRTTDTIKELRKISEALMNDPKEEVAR